MITTVARTLLLLLSLVACVSEPPVVRQRLAPPEVDRWLKGVQTMEVSTAEGRVLRTVTDPATMRAFVSLLPQSEFDDIFGEAGREEYRVRFLGPEYSQYDHYIWFSRTHVRYIPKGAARLEPGERGKILAALGVSLE
jgi:hypothetical protein